MALQRQHRIARAWLAAAVLVVAAPRAHSAPGDLDPTFGVGGIVTSPIGGAFTATDAAMRHGRVVVGGWTDNGTDRDLVLARYDTNGVLDPAFGIGGIVTTDLGGDEVGEGIAVQDDDKVVVAGFRVEGGDSEILVVRYNVDGGLDPTFGAAGVVRTALSGGAAAMAVVMAGDDIAIAGHAGTEIALVRYDRNGNPDSHFGNGGVVRTAVPGGPAVATAIVRIAGFSVAGWVQGATDRDVVVARYQDDGDLAGTFGTGGLAVTSAGGDDVPEALLSLLGGRVVVSGWSQGAAGTEVMLLRYAQDGRIETRFGSGGIVKTPVGTVARGTAVAEEPNGNLLVGGAAVIGGVGVFALLRYHADGDLDALFGSAGVVTTPIGSGDASAEALLRLPDERIVLAGSAAAGADVALAGYLRPPRCGNGIVEPEIGETCDGGNRANGDCCGATCLHDPAGSPCVDDGDACSDDRCDAAGSCLHPPRGGSCEHHFCYRAQSAGTDSALPVVLTDGFGTQDTTARRPRALCPPASVEGAAISDQMVHQESYELRQSPRRRRQDLRVADRFGLLHLRLLSPDRLLMPAHTALDGPPAGPPAATAANPFKCYRVAIARGAADFPHGVQAMVEDAFESRRYDVERPRRLCVPAAANGLAIVDPVPHLMCYTARRAAGEPRHTRVVGRLHTANGLAAEQLDTVREDELCVPALREPCGTLPPCGPLPPQNPDCTYDPAVTDAAYSLCRGPKIVIDGAHANFHTLEEPGGVAGRYWGFAKLLLNDGYDVQQTTESVLTLLPTTDAAVLVIANAQIEVGQAAVRRRDVAAIIDWVSGGGSLLLIIDHDPFDRVEALLAALGLELVDVSGGTVRRTFRRASGELNGNAAVANGPGPDSMVDEVTTFTGTAFRIAPNPPAAAQFEPVLVFGPGSGLEGLQGVAIRFGAGRVFVAGEAGSLTAQEDFGMQLTWDNERYVRNIAWWLTE